MRLLAGLLLLAALFAMAAGWQRRAGEHLRRQRTNEHGGPALLAEQEEGWSRLVLGRPSGADPILAPAAPEPRAAVPAAAPAVHAIAEPAEARYTVRSGDVLGRICQDYYRSARPELVEALAAHNGLANADALRVGQVLRLPALEALRSE